MEEDKHFTFMMDYCKPNCIALCMNFPCQDIGSTSNLQLGFLWFGYNMSIKD